MLPATTEKFKNATDVAGVANLDKVRKVYFVFQAQITFSINEIDDQSTGHGLHTI